MRMVDDKYIGLALAMSSSLAIGTSFIITKKGLMDSSARNGSDMNQGHEYLQNPIWWAGMITMAIGEIANFAAYTFAPAILVTPLGALSVIIGAVLAAVFLKEELGTLGKMGCAICLMGSVIIVLHAPPDKDIQTVDEILGYATRPGFLFYCFLVTVYSLFVIYKIVPKYGETNPMVYISIKALDQFDTSIVNPLYYVTFTTFTLLASFILFRGFNTASAINIISLLIGFLIIFSGVYLLNISRKDNEGRTREIFGIHSSKDMAPLDNGVGGFSSMRRSMQQSRDYDEETVGLRRFDSFEIGSDEDVSHRR